MSRASNTIRGWSTPILLFGMVLTSALTLVATEWTEQLEVVPLVGIGGLAAGILIAASTFPDWLTHLFSAVYGLAWTAFLVGDTLPGDLTWRERGLALGTRVSHWVYQAFTGGTGQDALIFLLLLSALFWVLGYNAAWNTYRRPRPWLTALPFGSVSIVVTHYYTGSAPLIRYLGAYLILALLYVGQVYTVSQAQIWRRDRVAFNPALRSNVLRSSLLLAVAVIVLAGTLPTVSAPATPVSDVWQRISAPWETVQEEWRRLFSSIHGEPVEVPELFGATLSLGGPSALEDTLVLDIEAPGADRYYWRASVYAIYDGRQWSLPPHVKTSVSAGERLGDSARDLSRRTVTQTVTNYLSGRRLMLGASHPVAFGREADALVSASQPLELYSASSALPLVAGDQYSVTSRISEATAPELRQAGTDYPDWVRSLYLQLPPSLPPRVRTLAETITAPADTPYGRARLLEGYLRATITYDLTPPPLPAGEDYADFLLFESQQGYCNGYATAMVVMARSLGIPARLATGYAEGELDLERGVFRVREDNAHTWPEVYFPDYGWIEFEPTVSEAPLVRPDPEPESPLDELPASPSAEDLAEEPGPGFDRESPVMDDPVGPFVERPSAVPAEPGSRSLLVGLLVIAALVGLAAAARWAAENWGLRHLPGVEQNYARLLRFGRWLGRPLEGSDTPLEWMRDFAAMVPEAREQIARIVELRAVARFGRGDPRDPAADVAWAGVRSLLWRQLLWDQWPKRLGPRRFDPSS